MEKILTFEKLVSKAPEDIKNILIRSEETPQSGKWHPEAPNDKVPHNVLKHIKIVYNRALKTGDLDLVLTAFFHDLGKAKTTRPSRKTQGSWSSYGHELESTKIVERHKAWIEELGGNYNRIHDLVKFHMKIKLMSEMRSNKQKELRENPYFEDLLKFSEFDNMKTLTEEELES